MSGRVRLLLVGAAIMASSPMVAQEAGYKIIVHESNAIGSLTKAEVAKIFLKKSSQWPNGNPVQPVDLPSSPARERFSKDIHGKSMTAILAFWQQQIFSGRGVPPPEKNREEEVAAHVKANPNAVGYVSADFSTDGLKVLKVSP